VVLLTQFTTTSTDAVAPALVRFTRVQVLVGGPYLKENAWMHARPHNTHGVLGCWDYTQSSRRTSLLCE
jgi:hypothetical protein